MNSLMTVVVGIPVVMGIIFWLTLALTQGHRKEQKRQLALIEKYEQGRG